MRPFVFEVERSPFPRWLGPFSPARGTYSGFRFHRGQLGTWMQNEEKLEFWPLVESAGAKALARTVLEEWRGGRVLFLPNGHVVKPLQRDMEVGRRVLVGRFTGPVVLEASDGAFDFSDPGQLVPGSPWPGPKTTGLECVLQPDGSLRCNWYHPAADGREEVGALVQGPAPALVAGFRKARPGDSGGRVRVTANGHVITNREWNGTWVSLYVGRVATDRWPNQRDWIEGGYR